jgi:drug/metabolite transporter (DMT)-like permease
MTEEFCVLLLAVSNYFHEGFYLNTKALGYILLLGVLFGSVTVTSRYLLTQLEPITYTGMRLSMAALAYLIVYLLHIRGRRWPRDPVLWKRAIFFGAIGDALPMMMIVGSMLYLSSGVTSILTTFFPVVTVVMAHFLLTDEPLTRRKGIGVVMGLAGAVLIAALGETGLSEAATGSKTGYYFMGIASLIIGYTTIYARKYLNDYDTFDTVSIRMFSAAIVSVSLAVIIEGIDLHTLQPAGYLALVYAAFVVFFGFFLWFYVLQRFGVMISAMANYLPPIVAAFGGFVFLNEKITWGMVTGMGLIIAGVVVINGSVKLQVKT